MRRGFVAFVAVVMSMVLIAGLGWAEKCHKAEAAKGQKCAQLKVCTKAAGAESAQSGEKCGKMNKCKGDGGCHSMMSSMPMGHMMMQRTMGGGKRAGMRGKGHAKAGELHRLGGPALFAHSEKKLDLTEKQVENLKALKWDFQKSALEKKAQIEVARVELNELMDQKSVDFGKIKAKISQIADLEKEMRLAHLASIERSHKLLTAEQLEKAKTLKMGRGPRVGGRTKEIIKEIIIEGDTGIGSKNNAEFHHIEKESSMKAIEQIAGLSKEELLKLIEIYARNWLAHDGCWFLATEEKYGLDVAIELDKRSWERFAAVEAKRIMKTFGIPENGGLKALEKAFRYRLYAPMNVQQAEWPDQDTLIFRMVTCRVQDARRRKGLPDSPCKPVGIVEFSTFARTVDERIETRCLGCPPDPVKDFLCGWEFKLKA